MSKKNLKVMNAGHVIAEIALDNPKAGEKVKVNGDNFVIVKDSTHGLVVQLDTTYEPHRAQLGSPGLFFTKWGIIAVVIILAVYIVYRLAS